MAEWQEDTEGGIEDEIALHPLLLLPPRGLLYERCDRRFELMLERGAMSEVEVLLARDLSPALPVMRAIGVPDIAALLRGEVSREQCIARGQQATRNYAKRQYTWFRRQPPQEWSRCESERCEVREHFETLFAF
jgi:tRNA dimethylallyltransferase